MNDNTETSRAIVPISIDVRARALITLSSEESEDDQRELATLFYEVTDPDAKKQILKKLNPNFDFCLQLIAREAINKTCRVMAGIAFNRISRISDFELRRVAYRAIAQTCPHDLVKRAAAKYAEGLGKVVRLPVKR